MAYASWSVSFGEQPSAAKWNILGTNDALFNTQVGSSFSSGTTSTVWWEELGRTSNSSQASISVSSFAARKYLYIEMQFSASTTMTVNVQFNSDTAANYAWRNESNGAADATGTTDTSIQLFPSSGAVNAYYVAEILNVSTLEKGVIFRGTRQTAGVANAPGKLAGAGKWVNTASQITTVTVNASTGNLGTASLVVLGHD